mgnify:CR=1 FL=1
MTFFRFAVLCAVTTALLGVGQAQTGTLPVPGTLVGSWTVDLRPTADSPPVLKKLVITGDSGGSLEGHFYDGSRLQAGRHTRGSGPEIHFAFFTDPGEGAYQTSGRQVSPDRLSGMTLSTTRGFLLIWEATRDVAP